MGGKKLNGSELGILYANNNATTKGIATDMAVIHLLNFFSLIKMC